ncbi:MAG: DUF1559 domain-containing protein [Planctomycetes bacterium]|nr:DUF1559 domain-containing protein [Planctomycetota bacterium]
MSITNSRRRGLTLIELLVLLAIVAVATVIALPGIQRARMQARNASCKNNLKTLALAFHNYHDTYKTFPPGWIAKNGAPWTGPCFGWGTSVLPFLEQAVLYNAIDFHKGPDPKSELFQTAIAEFRCPDDLLAETNPIRDGYGTSNYSGNYGETALPGSVEVDPRATGILFWNSKIGIRDITDGLSNTFLLGERSITSAGGIWPGVRNNQNAGDSVTGCHHTALPNTVLDSFSSKHDGGVNFVMCDGSVRFISNQIDSKPPTDNGKGLYQQLGHRADGEAVGNF